MKNIFFHPITALFFTILAVIFIISLQKTRQKSEQVVETADQLKNQVSQLKLELDQSENSLNQENIQLEQEKAIRNELLMQKEGEVVFQLPPIELVKQDVIEQQESLKPIEAWKQLFSSGE